MLLKSSLHIHFLSNVVTCCMLNNLILSGRDADVDTNVNVFMFLLELKKK